MGSLVAVANTSRNVVTLERTREGSDQVTRKPHPEGLLTTEEAAVLLRVHRSTIVRWVKAGTLKPTEARPAGRLRKGRMWFSADYLLQKQEEWREQRYEPNQ